METFGSAIFLYYPVNGISQALVAYPLFLFFFSSDKFLTSCYCGYCIHHILPLSMWNINRSLVVTVINDKHREHTTIRHNRTNNIYCSMCGDAGKCALAFFFPDTNKWLPLFTNEKPSCLSVLNAVFNQSEWQVVIHSVVKSLCAPVHHTHMWFFLNHFS